MAGFKMFYLSYYHSPLGCLLLACDGGKLTGLWLAKQKYYAAGLPETAQHDDSLPIFKQTKNWLDRYFQKQNPQIAELPLTLSGTPFRRQVWQLLCQIPYGEVTTYGSLAEKMSFQTGKKVSARAVGCAIGHNPMSIIIPCHRVVGANGSLTGYAGGLSAKIKLLTLEGYLRESDTKCPKLLMKI